MKVFLFNSGISFYSCLFGMLIHEAIAVIILQSFNVSVSALYIK